MTVPFAGSIPAPGRIDATKLHVVIFEGRITTFVYVV